VVSSIGAISQGVWPAAVLLP